MTKYLKISLFGFLVWLIPFVVSVAIFSIHEMQRPLFESIMPVTITACVVFFSLSHFKKTEADFLKEGVLLGAIWFAVNIIFDLMLFMEGPMKMPFADYMKDIGLTYLIIPIVTIGFGILLENKESKNDES
jgi:hypothetical protein